MEKSTQSENEIAITSETTEDTNQSQEPNQVLLAQAIHSEFSGPLPPPEILAQYEKIFPGASERIFQMAENQASHRRSMETNNLNLAARDSLFGIIFGFIIAMTGIIGGIIVIFSNPSSVVTAIGGSAISGVSLLGIIRTFVIGSKSQKKKKNDE